MDKIDLIKTTFAKAIECRGHVTRDRLSHIETQNFSGLTVFIEGNGLVFAQLGKKLPLNESTNVEVEGNRHFKFMSRDEDGPITIHLHVD